MGAGVCQYGHVYGGRSCSECRREKRAARRADAAPLARGVPTPVEADAWREDAACRHADGDDWFADKRSKDERDRAKAVCGGCPVAEACRDYARRTRQPWGILGGETAHQRGTAYVVRRSAP